MDVFDGVLNGQRRIVFSHRFTAFTFSLSGRKRVAQKRLAFHSLKYLERTTGRLRTDYSIFCPRAERTNSTPSNAVRLCSSRIGLISTTSIEAIDSVSAIISMARCASR